jgi:hypothetical protein
VSERTPLGTAFRVCGFDESAVLMSTSYTMKSNWLLIDKAVCNGIKDNSRNTSQFMVQSSQWQTVDLKPLPAWSPFRTWAPAMPPHNTSGADDLE